MRHFPQPTSLRLLLSLTFFMLSSLCMAGGAGLITSGDSFSNEPEFLDVDEAFVINVTEDKGRITVNWAVADTYYLYRERFSFSLEPANSLTSLSEVSFPYKGKMKDDPAFGMVEVYDKDIEARLSLLGQSTEDLQLVVGYQGCAEAGLCYPPQTRRFPISSTNTEFQTPTDPEVSQPLPLQTNKKENPPDNSLATQLMEGNLLFSLLTLYLLGLGLAFTPCVLPMVPILSSIIAGQNEVLTARKGFFLSLTYVLAMAMTYALAGILIGHFGAKANLQMYLQQPTVLISFAFVFVLLSFSMFGFYEIQLPAFLRDRLERLNQRQAGGNLIGVAIMGSLSALVVSPCVSAPLIGVLTYISATGDAVLGGGALFSLAMGMGTPLLVIGAGGGSLIPKAGGWMDAVKAVFGVMLLAVAIWMLERILPGPLTLALWAMLLMVSAVYLKALDSVDTGWQKLWKGLGVFMLIYGVLLLVGAASGESDPLKPLQTRQASINPQAESQSHSALFQPVNNLNELNAALASAKLQGRSVMLDFYADWCISCKIMERQTFSAAEVQEVLANTLLLQADISDLTNEGQAMLDHYGLFGLPSILFWSPDGEEQKEARVQGEMHAKQFRTHLLDKVIL